MIIRLDQFNMLLLVLGHNTHAVHSSVFSNLISVKDVTPCTIMIIDLKKCNLSFQIK